MCLQELKEDGCTVSSTVSDPMLAPPPPPQQSPFPPEYHGKCTSFSCIHPDKLTSFIVV